MLKFRRWSRDSTEPTLDVSEVYQQSGKFIWATLHRLGVAESDLPDVMQEVLVVIHRRLPTYDHASRLNAWLFGICTKVVANYRRRSFRRREQALPDLDGVDAQDPEVLSGLRDDQAMLEAVLERIDPARRAVFLMYEVEGFSCQQIAEELGIPVGTVHSRLHAARQEFGAAVTRVQLSQGVPTTTPSKRFGT